jgi:hypothetical protein
MPASAEVLIRRRSGYGFGPWPCPAPRASERRMGPVQRGSQANSEAATWDEGLLRVGTAVMFRFQLPEP